MIRRMRFNLLMAGGIWCTGLFAQAPVFQFSFEEGQGGRTRGGDGLFGQFTGDWGPGWSGYGLVLDGSSEKKVSVSLPQELRIGRKSFTLSCRIKPVELAVAGADKRRRFIGLEDRWPSLWAVLDLLSDGRPRFECGMEKKGFSHPAKGLLPLGEWSHLAFVFDREAGKCRWFVNGQLDSEKDLGTFADLDLTGEKGITFGSGFQNLTGVLDEVKLRTTVVSAADIASESREKPVKAPGAVRKGDSGPGLEPATRTENVVYSKIYHVGPDGKDGNTGLQRDGSDLNGPMASLSGAFSMLRGLKAKGMLSGPVTILMKPGIYFLEDTLVLTPMDSGSEKTPITVRAEKPGTATISGGIRLSGWVRKGDMWQTKVEGVADGAFFATGLFIGGERATRSRHPNKGFLRADKYIPESKDRFYYKEGDLKSVKDAQDIAMTVYHAWTASVHGLDQVDANQRLLVARNPATYVFGKWGIARYYLENALEFLDEPGEWHLSRATGVLSYLGKPGEDLNKVVTILTRLPRLVDFRGNPKEGKFISHLKFEGLSFQHVNGDFGPSEVIDGQAFAMVRRAAVFAQGLRDATFSGCEIAHGQVHGLWLEKGCSEVVVEKNHIWDLGGGGVYIGDHKLPEPETLATHHITVSNNFIHRLNLILHGSHGIWIGKGTHNTLTHNEICDLDYSPIGVGWTWGFAEPSGAHHNVITWNHLHHYGLGELSDMAGIYTLGVSPGTIVRYNHVHDASAYSYGGWGLYTDEGSTEVLMEKNLVYNTKSGGFHQHYGSNNLIQNNIFAFAGEANVISKRGDEKNRSLRFERNIVLTTNGFAVNIGFKTPAFQMERNLYWDLQDTSTNHFSFNGLSFPDWQEMTGYDRTSKVADPKFRNPLKLDFTFGDESIPRKMGFEPFLDEIKKAGLEGDPAWTGLPGRFAARPENEDREPPAPKKTVGSRWKLTEDFETVAPGVPTGVGSSDPGILVSPEQGFRGRHSLKFQDDVGLSAPWKPHLAINRSFGKGRLSMDFDLYIEPGCRVWVEGRDKGGSPYRVGPSFEISEDGALLISKKKEGSVPAKEWVHVKLTTDTSDSAAPVTWDLELTVAKQAPVTVNSIAMGDPQWHSLEALIFSANGQTRTAFYLDNLNIEVKPK